MTLPSGVAPRGMAHRSTELDKASPWVQIGLFSVIVAFSLSAL